MRKVGQHKNSALYITFKNQNTVGRDSDSAGEEVCQVLNDEARASWAATGFSGDGPWTHVCDFSVHMNGKNEAKRAMLFHNKAVTGVDINWIQKYMRKSL